MTLGFWQLEIQLGPRLNI